MHCVDQQVFQCRPGGLPGEAAIGGRDAAGQAFAPGVERLRAQRGSAGVGAGTDAAELVAIQVAQPQPAVAHRNHLPCQAVVFPRDRALDLVDPEGVARGAAGAAARAAAASRGHHRHHSDMAP